MPFSKLLGNETAKSTLLTLLQKNQLPHTLLFCGPEGVGKAHFAMSVAEYLMGPQAHAKLLSGNHPDLHVLHPEGKGALHPVENIRALIKESGLPPFEAPVKIFLIHDAHQMLPASSNALLKTLEEPSPGTYFILLSSEPNTILPTIVSRARKIAFFPIPLAEIQKFLELEHSPQEARRLALLSRGSLAKAKLLAEQTPKGGALIQSLIQLQLPGEYPQLLALCSELGNDEEEESDTSIETLQEEILSWYRDLHIVKSGIDLQHLHHPEALPFLQERLKRPIPALERVLEGLHQVQLALQRHIKPRTALEHFFICLSSISKA